MRSIALLLSVLVHGLIAAGVAVYIDHAPTPDDLPQIDLASVDLSFSETPDEAAEETTAAASIPKEQSLPSPETEAVPPLPPEIEQTLEPILPKYGTADLPQPDEPCERLETPPSDPVHAPRQAKVDAPPKPRRNIRPDYPRESRLRGEQGNVELEIVVNARGTVDVVHVVKSSGFPLLDEAACKAVRSARFTPAKTAGESVVSAVRLTLDFKLR